MTRPQLRYVNHLGQIYDFEKDNIWPISEELFDFSVDYEVSNEKIVSRTFPSVEIPLDVNMDTEDALREMNMFYRILIPDAIAKTPGRLYEGSWYVECLLKQSEKRYWYRDGQLRSYTLSLFVPSPIWTRDITYTFDISASQNGYTLGYPHGYPHGFGGSTPVKLITLDAVSNCDIKIVIFGAVDSPVIAIGPNIYRVDTQVPDSATLTIDTRSGEVFITTADGTVIDVFDETPDAPPGSGEYIFEQLSPGYHSVAWNGNFRVSLTTYVSQVGERQW